MATVAKGVADLFRRAQVCQKANERYLDALSSVDTSQTLQELTEQMACPTTWKEKRVRGINPFAAEDAALLEAVSRGEFALNGLRNRDLQRLLFATEAASPRRSAQALRAGHSKTTYAASAWNPGEGCPYASLPGDGRRTQNPHRHFDGTANAGEPTVGEGGVTQVQRKKTRNAGIIVWRPLTLPIPVDGAILNSYDCWFRDIMSLPAQTRQARWKPVQREFQGQ